MNLITASKTSPIARTGLIAKGIVYCILGALAFMAAFEIGGQSNAKTDKQAVFEVIQKQTGGQILLTILIAGLFCYAAWRFIETFGPDNRHNKKKSIAKRIRYGFSGLIYLSLAIYGAKQLFSRAEKDNKDSTQSTATELLSQPFGQWLVGLFGLIIAGVGIYQVYYGLSEKYRDHVSKLNTHAGGSKLLLTAGKIGYVSRGIVWLIIAWLLMKAAFLKDSSEAGDTAKAFGFLENSPYGSYLLGALAIGLICYGVFNFIRARYERL